ncbi:hypothetical protein EDC04DRAFT_3341 [Pisolithus marmoratus]|nr:hypothetical protein EDC04DRAFT_3341 [Pisolithus marmoratus]
MPLQGEAFLCYLPYLDNCKRKSLLSYLHSMVLLFFCLPIAYSRRCVWAIREDNRFAITAGMDFLIRCGHSSVPRVRLLAPCFIFSGRRSKKFTKEIYFSPEPLSLHTCCLLSLRLDSDVLGELLDIFFLAKRLGHMMSVVYSTINWHLLVDLMLFIQFRLHYITDMNDFLITPSSCLFVIPPFTNVYFSQHLPTRPYLVWQKSSRFRITIQCIVLCLCMACSHRQFSCRTSCRGKQPSLTFTLHSMSHKCILGLLTSLQSLFGMIWSLTKGNARVNQSRRRWLQLPPGSTLNVISFLRTCGLLMPEETEIISAFMENFTCQVERHVVIICCYNLPLHSTCGPSHQVVIYFP